MHVTVFGSARVQPGSPEYEEAFQLGRILATRGDVVVSGGYGGVMEAVSRGAHSEGGRVIGITMEPWSARLSANAFVADERAAGTLFQRIEMLVQSDALITLAGGAGTLAEMALGWNLRQMGLAPHTPVIVVGRRWRNLIAAFARDLVIDDRDLALLTVVNTVEDAVDALSQLETRGPTWVG